MDHEKISAYGDVLAIVGFVLLIHYMYKKKNRTHIENILFLFGISGFVVDVFLTIVRFA